MLFLMIFDVGTEDWVFTTQIRDPFETREASGHIVSDTLEYKWGFHGYNMVNTLWIPVQWIMDMCVL